MGNERKIILVNTQLGNCYPASFKESFIKRSLVWLRPWLRRGVVRIPLTITLGLPLGTHEFDTLFAVLFTYLLLRKVLKDFLNCVNNIKTQDFFLKLQIPSCFLKDEKKSLRARKSTYGRPQRCLRASGLRRGQLLPTLARPATRRSP